MKKLAKQNKSRSEIETKVDLKTEESSVLLTQSVWTESIGWMTQKTLRLDADEIERLRGELYLAEQVLRERKRHQDTNSNIIEFPKK